jgi:hypothetical protein
LERLSFGWVLLDFVDYCVSYRAFDAGYEVGTYPFKRVVWAYLLGLCEGVIPHGFFVDEHKGLLDVL